MNNQTNDTQGQGNGWFINWTNFLERNKERRKPPAELMESKEGVHDVSRGSDIQITSSVENKEGHLDLKNLISIEETLPNFNTY